MLKYRVQGRTNEEKKICAVYRVLCAAKLDLPASDKLSIGIYLNESFR